VIHVILGTKPKTDGLIRDIWGIGERTIFLKEMDSF
jgi:hypothetical protein